MEEGRIPTRAFSMSHLRSFFNHNIAGQLMRAGGATNLAEHSIPLSIIQAAG